MNLGQVVAHCIFHDENYDKFQKTKLGRKVRKKTTRTVTIERTAELPK